MGGRHRAPLLLLCVLLVGTWVTSASARAAEIVAATPHLESRDSEPSYARPALAGSAERRLTRADATVVAVIPQTTSPRAPASPIAHHHDTRPVHDEAGLRSCADARAPPRGPRTAHLHLT